MTTRYLAVAGTHASRRTTDWDDPGSPFAAYLRGLGIVPLVEDPRRRYQWSTDLNGVPGDGDHADWDASGRALANTFFPVIPGAGGWDGRRQSIPPADTNLITHSHGLQVALYACGRYGLRVHTLIDVAGPVRRDLQALATAARPRIGTWLHLSARAGWRDLWQVAGELFDGHLGIVRAHPLADRNDTMPRGHADVLRDPALFPLWLERGWLAPLLGPLAHLRARE